MNTTDRDVNPIALRDLVIDEPNGRILEDALLRLVARGWPTEAILAELPGVSESEVRRARERAHARAA